MPAEHQGPTPDPCADQLRAAALATLDNFQDPTDAEGFLDNLRTVAHIESSARQLLHELIAQRDPQIQPSMRQIAAATGLSHSTVFRIIHRDLEPTTPHTNGEAL